jgi:hypothetical protein
MHRKLTVLLLIIAAALAGCGGDEGPAVPTAVSSPTAASAAAAQATETVAATATVTPLPPPPTAAPPTETAVPPTPTATATPEPVTLLTLQDFGQERNPLTGEVVADTAVLERRPVAVKISNSPPEHVRPQAGLSRADLVFEHATEGPITRFTAIFYGDAPPDVGPIRSARLIDVELPAMYDAALAYSGSSIGVGRKLGGSDFRPRIIRSFEPGYYRTGEDKPWEHTLHGDLEGFWQALAEKEQNTPPQFSNVMAFSSLPPEGGEPAEKVTIEYQDWTTVEWEYDAENGRYWRWADGEAHVDANDDEQISAANVVLVYAIHMLDQSICERQVEDQCYAFSTEIQIWGSGDAVVIRDGRQYAATWQRQERDHMLTFVDENGDPVPLQIGNTWFQVIPWHYDDPVTITPNEGTNE